MIRADPSLYLVEGHCSRSSFGKSTWLRIHWYDIIKCPTAGTILNVLSGPPTVPTGVTGLAAIYRRS
eukprot:g43891.t1